jgi:hypothetical protein
MGVKDQVVQKNKRVKRPRKNGSEVSIFLVALLIVRDQKSKTERDIASRKKRIKRSLKQKMRDRYLKAFELQFLRFLDEVMQVYPQETDLSLFRSALQMKQTISPEATRNEIYTYFVSYIYEPYQDLIQMENILEAEQLWVERMRETNIKATIHSDYSDYFDRFNTLFLYNTHPDTKAVLWKYMKSLGELIGLIQQS